MTVLFIITIIIILFNLLQKPKMMSDIDHAESYAERLAKLIRIVADLRLDVESEEYKKAAQDLAIEILKLTK